MRSIALLSLTALLISCAPSDSTQSSYTVPLYDNLGDHHRSITTESATAQNYFDQGLRLVYAFNHAEAIRAFEQAVELDPACAMCYWGIGYASGPNINAAMEDDAAEKALQATRSAVELKDSATPIETGMIDALALRYSDAPGAERAALDSAYADAINELATRYPEDDDLATFAAESRMLLRPWDYWTSEKEPRPGTETILALLEGVIDRNPDHAGACHFYIHAVEAAYPERGVACAERLPGLMPGAGHLVHMPAHVYIRVGRYGDAVDANVHAVHADEAFIEDQNPDGLYRHGYYPHNYHFMAFAAMMSGRDQQAIEAARSVAQTLSFEAARDIYFLESGPAYPQLALMTFGRWEETLEEPLPSEDLPSAAGLAHYARGIAFAALGQRAEAEAALERLREFAAVRAEAAVNPASEMLPIAIHALQAEIALRSGDPATAVTHFEAARDLEDAMLYDEPPVWFYPIRHSLGRAHLEAGDPVGAETVYREDLARFPENGWSLFGLEQALRAQGRNDEADAVSERFERAWQGATVTLTASRF